MRRKARKDGNHVEIVMMLRQIPGVTVTDTAALGDGFVDIVVGFRGRNYLFEIKDGSKPPSQRKLTDDEKEWHRKWTGRAEVVKSFDEILKSINSHEPLFTAKTSDEARTGCTCQKGAKANRKEVGEKNAAGKVRKERKTGK